jgi:hypothetical protein
VLSGAMISIGRTLEKQGPALYSPECAEVEFSEVRRHGVLGPSVSRDRLRSDLRIGDQHPEHRI